MLFSLLALCSTSLVATDVATWYEPCEAAYYVGLSAEQLSVVSKPTMVAAAYGAKFNSHNALVASGKAGNTSYSLQKYIESDTLNLSNFMGVGALSKLLVRDASGHSYQLGSLMGNTSDCQLWAAYNYEDMIGSRQLPIAMYNSWDCPVIYSEDETLAQSGSVRVQFHNPGEGLVSNSIEFALLGEKLPASAILECLLTVGKNIYSIDITSDMLVPCGQKEGHDLYTVTLNYETFQLDQAFTIEVKGFNQEGVHMWLPRTSDVQSLFTSHTTYGDGTPMNGDACINLMGYYNYIGDWGIAHGKQERGEVVTAGDYVQVYYDPSEEGYIDRFMGEVTFPVECTFGINDIYTKECPDWIETGLDDSQWEEYEAVQLIMMARELPEGVSGRLGKVVFSTLDDASQYTILVIQGNAWFEENVKLLPTSITNQSGRILPDSTIVNDDEDISTQVTHIYLHYAEPLLKNPSTASDMAYSRSFANYVTIRKVDTNKTLSLNAYSCGLKAEPGKSEKSIIDIFLSGDNYINTSSMEGLYEVTILEGLATNLEGVPTEPVTFRFRYGEPTDHLSTLPLSVSPRRTKRYSQGKFLIINQDDVYGVDGILQIR